ncbi:hypothetical protein Q5H92_03125 [Hymenobacter sp. M29]|uniref:Uncharacterized protein n=1 Tax=Hymenobacter mellowenesis TaxID=3063995 RepID=A0ABT9A666_9BACT|nr:hypothetical protein [Hymenobacter sp. M29]MDO7845335.1 hypothetical protein [Hymenobacter sp. M29]
MKKVIWFLVWLLPQAIPSRAQSAAEKLRYQLAESILKEFPAPFAYAKRTSDGKYHRQPPMATDTPTVRLLLLDRPYSTDADYEIVLAGEGTPAQAQARKYFSTADIAYMRQQLPASKRFKFEQARIREPGVRVISLDTLMAMNKRLGWRARILARDSLFQRFGSDRTFAIGGILFSKNHQRALVNVGGEGWEACVYTKVGTGWRREATLIMVEY